MSAEFNSPPDVVHPEKYSETRWKEVDETLPTEIPQEAVVPASRERSPAGALFISFKGSRREESVVGGQKSIGADDLRLSSLAAVIPSFVKFGPTEDSDMGCTGIFLHLYA